MMAEDGLKTSVAWDERFIKVTLTSKLLAADEAIVIYAGRRERVKSHQPSDESGSWREDYDRDVDWHFH